MNALNSDWVSEEAASRAHDIVEDCYEQGLFSLAVPVLSAAADSYVDHRSIEIDRPDLVGPEYDNDLHSYMAPQNEGERSFSDRLEYLQQNSDIPDEEAQVLDDMWSLRNDFLYSNDDVLRISQLGNEDRGGISSYLQDFEDLIGVEETISSIDVEENLEGQIREGSRDYSEFLEVMVSTAYNHDEDSLNIPAAALAYERLSNQIDCHRRSLERILEEVPRQGLVNGERLYNDISDNPERFVTFENQRNLISHEIESYSGIDIPEFRENIDFVLEQCINGEDLPGELVLSWNTWSDLRLGPPMYKTEALW